MDAWGKARVLLVVSAVAAVALVLMAIVALFTMPRGGSDAMPQATQPAAPTPTAPTLSVTPVAPGLSALQQLWEASRSAGRTVGSLLAATASSRCPRRLVRSSGLTVAWPARLQQWRGAPEASDRECPPEAEEVRART